MNRILLIARREYLAYARTVGFWLSLLAFPLFAVLGGGFSVLVRHAEPVRVVALIEDTGTGPAAGSLAAIVRDAMAAEQARADVSALRRAAIPEAGVEAGSRVSKVAEAEGYDAGLAALKTEAPHAGAGFKRPKQALRVVAAPPAIASAAAGAGRDDVIRRYLTEKTPVDGEPLSGVVILSERAGEPTARLWLARASDARVEDAIRDALSDANRRAVFSAAGIDPQVVAATDAWRSDVSIFSPRSSSGGEVSFRDRLPGVIGFAFGFLLWSLIITGASILLNSVMEEKSNKILEVLLSSASATEILTGKVLGVAMLTLSVLVVWAVLGGVGLATGMPDVARDVASVLLNGGLLIYFLLYMIGGYLMYAVLFAAIGAFCETPRDAQTLMGPIMMVLVVPILVMQMALQNPDAPVVRILSWIPFFTPFLMSARVPSDPPMIEIIGTLFGMFATALLMVWLAGRAFRAGALSDVKLSWKAFASAIRGGGE